MSTLLNKLAKVVFKFYFPSKKERTQLNSVPFKKGDRFNISSLKPELTIEGALANLSELQLQGPSPLGAP